MLLTGGLEAVILVDMKLIMGLNINKLRLRKKIEIPEIKAPYAAPGEDRQT